jgi:hypothetical protein
VEILNHKFITYTSSPPKICPEFMVEGVEIENLQTGIFENKMVK